MADNQEYRWRTVADAIRATKPNRDTPSWDLAESILTWEAIRDKVGDTLGVPREQWIAYIEREPDGR